MNVERRDRRVYFRPREDITLAELVEILRCTIFREPGSEAGVYRSLSEPLRRHFEVVD